MNHLYCLFCAVLIFKKYILSAVELDDETDNQTDIYTSEEQTQEGKWNYTNLQ